MTENSNNNNNEILYWKVYRNQFIRTTIFNKIKEFNSRLKYTRYNYYDIPIESIINNNKSMIIDKFKFHNNGKSKIVFEINWFQKLIDWKELDIELFQIVYSTFKNEVEFSVHLKQQLQHSCNTNQLILNNKLKILKILDNIKYGKKQQQSQPYNFILPSKLYGQLYPIENILSFEMLEYLIKERNVIITKEYFNVSFTFINDRTELVCDDNHFKYLEFLYNEIKRNQHRQERDEIDTSLLLLGIKTNDSRIYKLLFGYDTSKPSFIKTFAGGTEKLIQFCDGVKIRLVELKQFKNLNHLLILSFIGDIRNKFQFNLCKSLVSTIPYQSYVINCKLIDKGPLEYNSFNLLYDRVNCKLITDKLMTIHYSINCLEDDLSNKHLFIGQTLTLYKSLDYITQITIDNKNKLKMEYLIDNFKIPLVFNHFINSNTNESKELINKLFTGVYLVIGIEQLCSIAQSGYYNIIEAIFTFKRSPIFNNSAQLILALFKSMEHGLHKLYFMIFQIIEYKYIHENEIVFNSSLIFDYLDQNPLPVDPEKRSFFLSCLNDIFKYNQNGNNLFHSFIQFIIKKKFSRINHSIVYILNLTYQDCLKLNIIQSRQLIKHIIDSNMDCRIYQFIESIAQDLNFYIKYTIRQNYFSTFIKLIKFMPSSTIDDEKYKIKKIIKYSFKFKNYNILNYILSIDGGSGSCYNIQVNNYFNNQLITKSNFNNLNYYLNYCHFQILLNCTHKIEIPLIEYLYKINYKYSPTINFSTSEIYSILPIETIDKISSTQTLFKFIDNIGLSQYFKKSNNNNDNLITDNLEPIKF